MDERHLFVYIDPQNYLPWVALVDEPPPQQGPSLPSEITYVWAATRTRSADEFVVWKAERAKIWQSLGVVVAPHPMREGSSNWSRHRITALWRAGMKLKGRIGAARGARGR